MLIQATGPASRARNERTGFTLIELLVVVAIVALLISILLPSLARARAQSKSVLCLSQLRQQGVAAYMYAHESRALLPTSNDNDTISKLEPYFARQLNRMVSGGHAIFFCPENDLIAWTAADFGAALKKATSALWIRYWWLANPTGNSQNPPVWPANAARFLDTYDTVDSNGRRIRAKYMVKADDRNSQAIAISTDGSRMASEGWTFIHGRRQTLPKKVAPKTLAEALATGLTSSWKNTLYGDGHAAPVRANKVIARWGPNNHCGW